MLTFDAPMREMCVVRRSRTNTPLQALVTLNETGFVEASRHFAQRLLQNSISEKDRLAMAFKLAFGRGIRPNEEKIMSSSLRKFRERFTRDPKAAKGILAVGEKPSNPALNTTEHASWTLVCNILLNTDEFLTNH